MCAKLTSFTEYKVKDKSLEVATLFTNHTNEDYFVLLNTWHLSCHSSGVMLFSRIKPNGTDISIIPQDWVWGNHIIIESAMSFNKLENAPCYLKIPKKSKRKLRYTIDFEDRSRMVTYLKQMKLLLFYTYQLSDGIDSVNSIFRKNPQIKIYNNQELNLKNIIKVDVVKKKPSKLTLPDLKIGFSLFKNLGKITEHQAILFQMLPKESTEEQYVNLDISEKKRKLLVE